MPITRTSLATIMPHRCTILVIAALVGSGAPVTASASGPQLPRNDSWAQQHPAPPSVDEFAEAIVLMRDMRRIRGTLVSVDAVGVTVRGANGALIAVAASDVVAVLGTAAAPMPRNAYVEFADGQRLPGRPVFEEGSMRWRHDQLGVLTLEPDRLRRIVLDPAAPRVESTRDDVVVLLNGDRLEGIVSGLGSSVTIERDAVGEQRVPIERIASISFVNEARAAEAGDAVVWLADGSVLRSERPSLADDGIVRMRPALRPTTSDGSNRPTLLPMASLTGILFMPDVIVPLASLSPHSVEVPVHRLSRFGPVALEPNAAMGLSSIRLRGPISVSYRLQRRGMRLVAEVVMPDEALAWGDLELVILDGDSEFDRERLRQRINAASRRVSIDIVLEGDRLTIRLEEGERGPIQDVLILREAMLGPGTL